MNERRSLILGVNGQDGSYLAEHLLSKGGEVHGLIRRTSHDPTSRLGKVLGHPRFHLHEGDLLDPLSLRRVLFESFPDEIYNEADQDHVGWSFKAPQVSIQTTTAAVGNLLECCLELRRLNPGLRVFQPLSATMFGAWGNHTVSSQHRPLSPYACAKAATDLLCGYYREVHGLYILSCILYNHDSPRRSGEYLLHRLCRDAAKVALGEKRKVKIYDGDDTVIELLHARDVTRTFPFLLRQDPSGRVLLASGRGHSVRELAGRCLRWMGIDRYEDFIEDTPADDRRPDGPVRMVGDPGQARALLGPAWPPATDSLDLLINELLAAYQVEDQGHAIRLRKEETP